MAYCQLFYHAVWATKDRQPLITAEIEAKVHNFIRTKALGLGAKVFAVNGMPDHVHLVATIPPTIAVSKFIGQVKGASSAKLDRLTWQDKYGVFSFDKKRLPEVVRYVEQQKRHHAKKTTIRALERVDESDGDSSPS